MFMVRIITARKSVKTQVIYFQPPYFVTSLTQTGFRFTES